jgi:hypothetical protein
MSENPGEFQAGGPSPEQDGEALVLVFQAASNEEAEVVSATLNASGIKAVLLSATVNPVLGGLDSPMRDTAGLGIYVMPEDLEAARALLASEPPTDEELAEEATSSSSDAAVGPVQ